MHVLTGRNDPRPLHSQAIPYMLQIERCLFGCPVDPTAKLHATQTNPHVELLLRRSPPCRRKITNLRCFLHRDRAKAGAANDGMSYPLIGQIQIEPEMDARGSRTDMHRATQMINLDTKRAGGEVVPVTYGEIVHRENGKGIADGGVNPMNSRDR